MRSGTSGALVTAALVGVTLPFAAVADDGSVTLGPVGLYAPQYSVRPTGANHTYDLRRSEFHANEDGPFPRGVDLPRPLPDCVEDDTLPEATGGEKYPVSVRGALDGLRVLGPRVVGDQRRDIVWRLMKRCYDGDGVRIEFPAGGRATVEGASIENVMDAVSFVGDRALRPTWCVRGVRATWIRDDFVENDQLLSGEIRDCLVEGVFVFLSQRPGSAGVRPGPAPVVRIEDTLVHLNPQPYDVDMKGDSPEHVENGRGVGQPFKWSSNSGTVVVKNTMLRIDAASVNDPDAMDFPPGTYEGVTLVWLGDDDYPGELPAKGVRVSVEVRDWDDARAAWLAAHR